ncbi:CCA tRNA nucleotidyltransferase [Rhodovarius crocodyli]|uniref:CCA tRNA nucleotidyltransferase n=1 Tax=Rhodovarius crocodyli TaxID=1979269 RepID=A0A437MNB3_9PROT|nr:CCA tRNA nucleotidyltransferase [Rhodovarius crocodyli]RVT99138.1 CCA tRNA nucleotidyltransferase [Rhodovarius crocodyli]
MSLTPPTHLMVVRQALAALPGARIVGGAVRDHLAGRPVNDIDLSSAYPPEIAASMLRRSGFKVFETGLAHGTITAVRNGLPLEVTTLRRDVEADGRHADVIWTDSWQEDALRRDFTINAMSMDVHGNIYDYFGGMADLRDGCVRFIANATMRIREDYLRSLRFFRFWARYGRGAPDSEAISAIAANLDGLRILSVERIWMELKRLLEAPDPCDALVQMQGCGLWTALFPEATPLRIDLLRLLAAQSSANDVLLRLASLLPDAGAANTLATRLKMSGDEAARLRLLLNEALPVPAEASDRRGMRLLLLAAGRPGGDAQHDAAAWLRLREARDGVSASIREALRDIPTPIFPLQGRDLIALGHTPGPELGRKLQSVKDWWVSDGAAADRDACLLRLAELAKPGGAC